MRGALLARYPWCAACLADGVYTPADELDHVRPAHLAPDRFFDVTNLQGLCRWHHRIKTLAERAARLAKKREGRDRALRDWGCASWHPVAGGSRFIPARAGNTLPIPRRATVRTVHPRAGGEHPDFPNVFIAQTGSSPRGRGTPLRSRNVASMPGRGDCHNVLAFARTGG